MKTSVFNNKQFSNLDELGCEMASNFSLGLEFIKTKEFLKFINKFKNVREKIKNIMYSTKYLQNTLTFIIYQITNEKILIVGNKQYKSLSEIILDIKNDYFKLFIKDKGFANTILDTLEDESLKNNLKILELNSDNSFALDFIANYYNYDSNDSLNDYLKNLDNVDDNFKAIYNLFKNEDFLNVLAQKYSLKVVLEIINSNCCVFKGLNLISDQLENSYILNVLDNNFYKYLLNNIEKYRAKTKYGKTIIKRLKKYNKKLKSYNSKIISEVIIFNEAIYESYINFVNLYNQGEIVVKRNQEDYYLDVIYCNNYIIRKYANERNLISEEQNTIDFIENKYLDYDLEFFHKRISNIKCFGTTLIFFDLLLIFIYGILLAISSIDSLNIYILPITNSYLNMMDIIFLSSLVIALFLMSIILIYRSIMTKIYFKLGRLNYLKNNLSELAKDQMDELDKTQEKEQKYVKKLEFFVKSMRFLGPLVIFTFACGIITISIGLLKFIPIFEESANLILYEYYFYPILLALVVAILGLVRCKKTSFSIIFTLILSLLLSIGLVYIM